MSGSRICFFFAGFGFTVGEGRVSGTSVSRGSRRGRLGGRRGHGLVGRVDVVHQLAAAAGQQRGAHARREAPRRRRRRPRCFPCVSLPRGGPCCHAIQVARRPGSTGPAVPRRPRRSGRGQRVEPRSRGPAGRESRWSSRSRSDRRRDLVGRWGQAGRRWPAGQTGRSKRSSRPSSASHCSPTWAKPRPAMVAREAALSGLMAGTEQVDAGVGLEVGDGLGEQGAGVSAASEQRVDGVADLDAALGVRGAVEADVGHHLAGVGAVEGDGGPGDPLQVVRGRRDLGQAQPPQPALVGDEGGQVGAAPGARGREVTGGQGLESRQVEGHEAVAHAPTVGPSSGRRRVAGSRHDTSAPRHRHRRAGGAEPRDGRPGAARSTWGAARDRDPGGAGGRGARPAALPGRADGARDDPRPRDAGAGPVRGRLAAGARERAALAAPRGGPGPVPPQRGERSRRRGRHARRRTATRVARGGAQGARPPGGGRSSRPAGRLPGSRSSPS